MTSIVKRVADAIEKAQCPGREGPFGLFDYSDYATQMPHRVRDFRDPSADDYGKTVFQSIDREQARSEYERFTREHIARAAIEALREPNEAMTEAMMYHTSFERQFEAAISAALTEEGQ